MGLILRGLGDTSDTETDERERQTRKRRIDPKIRALVDIIPTVKHAVGDQQPLFTAHQRVDRAIQQVAAGREVTEEQPAWLNRIRRHFVENLSIDREDSDDLPVFAREGGWANADGSVTGRLGELIDRINAAIAA